ncbi:DUF4177 domain-containing protein [Candidatus Gracilibacteria bacterium]|nr:DUF4177 domain-containing protein [Candidatus Gracilibacteria bacterium]
MSSEGMPTIRLQAPNERWEYKVIRYHIAGFLGPNLDIDDMAEYFNRLGESGWELVSMTDINRGQGSSDALIATFKRRVHA